MQPQTLAPEVPYFRSHSLQREVYLTELADLADPELTILSAEVESSNQDVRTAYNARFEAGDDPEELGGLYGLKKQLGVMLSGIRQEQHRRRVAASNAQKNPLVIQLQNELAQVRESRDFWRNAAEAVGVSSEAVLAAPALDSTEAVQAILHADKDAQRARSMLCNMANELQGAVHRRLAGSIEARFMDLAAQELDPVTFTRLAQAAAGQQADEAERKVEDVLAALAQAEGVLKALANGVVPIE